MVIFLYGEDSYRSRQKLEEIVGRYKEVRKSGLNFQQYDAGESSWRDIYDNFKISPMFSEKRLVVIKNTFSYKLFQEDLLGVLETLAGFKDVVVIYEGGTVDERTKLFKMLLKTAKSQEFKQLHDKGLRSWALQEFLRQNQKINADALDALIGHAGSSTWRLAQEIKKLAHFTNGAVVRKADVELLVRPDIETDIFKTIDALAQKNKKQAIAFLQKHLDNGDNPLYLLSMVAYQFRNLLIVKELAEQGMMYASIVKKSGLHPFVVKKNYFQSGQFSFMELKRIYQAIFQTDADIKRGKIDPETALHLLIAKV